MERRTAVNTTERGMFRLDRREKFFTQRVVRDGDGMLYPGGAQGQVG